MYSLVAGFQCISIFENLYLLLRIRYLNPIVTYRKMGYGHKMGKSLIPCGPNSNNSTKFVLKNWLKIPQMPQSLFAQIVSQSPISMKHGRPQSMHYGMNDLCLAIKEKREKRVLLSAGWNKHGNENYTALQFWQHLCQQLLLCRHFSRNYYQNQLFMALEIESQLLFFQRAVDNSRSATVTQ